MDDSNEPETDVGTITDDIAALKRDLAALVEHFKRDAIHSATGTAAQLGDEAADIYTRLAAEGARSARVLARQVEEQPVASLLIAFAIGFLGSRLLSR
jgi:hypothetical protein